MMSRMDGYGGKVLRVDLSNKSIEKEETDISWFSDVIGGRAANSKRLLEELPPECDALGPKNKLLFGIGPLTGSILPASAYYTISAKSPMTEILGDSAAGGQFGSELKQTGYDQIIIEGEASELSYLFITDEEVEIRECPELQRKSVLEITKEIREETSPRTEVAGIGLAGENEVRFASVISSGNRANGRSGLGAVMGSKNLKAVAVNGKKPVTFNDPVKLLRLSQKMHEDIKEHEEYDERHELGTTMLMNNLNDIGILPTKHFQEGKCSYVDEISGEKLSEEFNVKNKSCFNCGLHCSRYYITEETETEAEGPEYETLCSFTSKIDNDDPEFALKINSYLNKVGLDSISTGEIISWLMECQEKDILQPEDVGGHRIKWGDKEKTRELVEKITKREGIGDELAEGATRFSKKFNKAAQEKVMQVKGLDIICGDPRGIKAYGLTYATSTRGADHLRAEPYFELTNNTEEAKKRFGTEKAAKRLEEEGKPQLVTYSEKIALLTDSLTMCKNIGLCMDILDIETAKKALKHGPGLEYTKKELKEVLEKGINRERELNKKFNKELEETLPKRFTQEPLQEGESKGSTVDIKKMVKEYKELH